MFSATRLLNSTERIKTNWRCDYAKPQRQMPVRFRQDVQRLLWKAEVTVSGQAESGQPPSERPDSASFLLQGRFLEEPLMKTRKSVKKKYGAKASRKVEHALHEMKEGGMRSGRSGK
jgi:hypothetical protein